MFKFLKELFKERSAERHEVSIDSLGKWFDSRTAPLIEGLRKQISYGFGAINAVKNVLQESTSALENAEIPEPEKIQERVKQVVLGHRDNYVKRLRQFISSMNVPESADCKEMLAWVSSMEKELNEFSASTTKTYYAVQHLFYNEVEEIAKALRDFDAELKRIKKIAEEKNIAAIESLKIKISALQNQIKKKAMLEQQIEESKAKLAENITAKEKAAKAITELEKSEESTKARNLSEQLSGVKKEMEDIENEIVEMFAPLEKCLKKYSKIVLENEKLIEEYSSAPLKALLHDDEMKINEILRAMRKAVESGSIELEDRKKEKALATLDSITADKLKDFVARYEQLRERMRILEKQLKANKAAQQRKELDYKVEHAEWMAGKLNEDIAKLEQEKAKIDIEGARVEVENVLRELLKIDVKIIV